jgi:hypothetical protein
MKERGKSVRENIYLLSFGRRGSFVSKICSG